MILSFIIAAEKKHAIQLCFMWVESMAGSKQTIKKHQK